MKHLRLAFRAWPADATPPSSSTASAQQPGVVKAERRRTAPAAEKRRDRFVVEESTDELLIRVRLNGTHGENDSRQPPVITQRNCHEVGLSKRQFLEAVRSGMIPGGRLPGTKIVATQLEDVLRVVKQVAARQEFEQHDDDQDDVDAVLAAVGQQRRPGGR